MLRWRWGWGGVGMKDSVPDQLPTCKENKSKLNDMIWTYVRAWQWRWQSHVLGQALVKKNWSLFGKDVASPGKCAAAVISQPTTYENGPSLKCQICSVDRKIQVKLKITKESALKNDMHQAKNTVKRTIIKIASKQNTLFYTDGKQPGG